MALIEFTGEQFLHLIPHMAADSCTDTGTAVVDYSSCKHEVIAAVDFFNPRHIKGSP
jgi:hypothetical protein